MDREEDERALTGKKVRTFGRGNVTRGATVFKDAREEAGQALQHRARLYSEFDGV